MGQATENGRTRSARAPRDTGAVAPRRRSRTAIAGLALLGLAAAGAGTAAYLVRSRGVQADLRTIAGQNVRKPQW
jgi:ferric-dicitrate binding protein FerR (iron transport regulator)